MGRLTVRTRVEYHATLDRNTTITSVGGVRVASMVMVRRSSLTTSMSSLSRMVKVWSGPVENAMSRSVTCSSNVAGGDISSMLG